MANVCRNTLTLIGLQEAPESFVKLLSKIMLGVDLDLMDPAMWGEDSNIDGKSWYRSLVDEYRRNGVRAARYGILYPTEPYSRLSVTAPRYYLETKWEPPQHGLIEFSKAFPDPTIHLSWWVEQDGPSGETVIRNGKVIDEIRRPASWYLFDHALLYPSISLLPAHMNYTLAQRGALRVEDAINTIEDLRNILDDRRFLASPQTPFSECRDHAKTEKLRIGLAALHESIVAQAQKLDFSGVFLEEEELKERYLAVVEADKDLMQRLGLEPLQPAPGTAARFSIPPFQVAITKDPDRVVLLVLHYANADPVSGKYQKNADGSFPPIAWELKYLCLTPADVRRINRLPDENQTPCDLDLAISNSGDRPSGREFYCVRNGARWTQNPELVKEVEREATKISGAFVAKVAEQTGMTIVADFRAVVDTLFPKTAK
jgi:hypothetical protein